MLSRALAAAPVLAAWKPKRKSFCPSPGWGFIMMEAATTWGYVSMTAWDNEETGQKGKVIAWYLLRGMREAYEMEKQMEDAKKGEKDSKDSGEPPPVNPAFTYGRAFLEERLAALRQTAKATTALDLPGRT